MSLHATRRAVAVTPVNDTIVNAQALINSGDIITTWIENASTTDDLFDSLDSASLPVDVDLTQLKSTMGNLLNAFVYTSTSGLELYIDEALDGTNLWVNTAGWAITALVPLTIRGFRFITPYVRVRIVHTGQNFGAVYYGLRGSTS